MYGYNKDKTIDIRSDEKGELDYAISNMFQMLKDSTRFDAERVERVFWERVSALVNYHNTKLNTGYEVIGFSDC